VGTAEKMPLVTYPSIFSSVTGNHAMIKHLIHRVVVILLVAPCYRNLKKGFPYYRNLTLVLIKVFEVKET